MFEVMILRRWGLVLILGLVGVGLMGYGVWEQVRPREVVVEVIKGQDRVSEKVSEAELVVDVAGAVEKPGIYKLAAESRIGDALVRAGGLAANADREWVATTLNLAERIEDGAKIYIPRIVDMSQSGELITQGVRKVETTKININTASINELDSLVGIGSARAESIVLNRPYDKTEEIVTKAKIPKSVYDKIKDSLSVY